jgi:hypothetical protein
MAAEDGQRPRPSRGLRDGAKSSIFVVFLSVALCLVYLDLLTSFGCNSSTKEGVDASHPVDAAVDAPGASPDAAVPDASVPDASTDSGIDATVTDAATTDAATTDAATADAAGDAAGDAAEAAAPIIDASSDAPAGIVFINGWQCASEVNCSGDAGKGGWACCEVGGAGYPARCTPAVPYPGPQTCGGILFCDPTQNGGDCYGWTGGGASQCLSVAGASAPTADGGVPLYQCGN